MKDCLDNLEKLKEQIDQADAVVIGAGAGLSTSAGFCYKGERFQIYFADMENAYGFRDMYSGGFYPYESPEEMWAFWSRSIFVNRYMDAPKPVYETLFELVKDKNYFVLTTNVDHCFQKAGFDKKRLFYTQGDYGLFQCSRPCYRKTYDNEEAVKRMVESQGVEIQDGKLIRPVNQKLKRKIPSELVPRCPRCGRVMAMNLRCDDTFVEDKGWGEAKKRYQKFLKENQEKRIVFLELGVGYNTPGIIKYSFWQMTAQNPKATYACLNYGEAYAPEEISSRAICLDGDIGEILTGLQGK